MASDPDQPRRDVDGDIVVPTSLYKVVTVFSTFIAVALVVLGFLFLDAATGSVRRLALLGWIVGFALIVGGYLGYLSLRSNARTLERLLVGAVLAFVVGIGVPGVPGVPTLVQSALDAAALSESQYQVLFGVCGLGLIAGGAGVYILGTRFRTEGMGNPKDDAD